MGAIARPLWNLDAGRIELLSQRHGVRPTPHAAGEGAPWGREGGTLDPDRIG